jgi:hypothetical protein
MGLGQLGTGKTVEDAEKRISESYEFRAGSCRLCGFREKE